MQYLNTITRTISVLLLVAQINLATLQGASALASGSAVFTTQVANFGYPDLVQSGQSILNTASNIASKYSVFMSANKETFLDSIAYQISRVMIKQMRDSMINWIQTGYDQKPLFLVNPEQMLRSMAAAEAKMVLNDVSYLASYSVNSLSAALVNDLRNNQMNTQAAFQAAIKPTLFVTIQNNVCSAEGFGLLSRQKGWTDQQARAARYVMCESSDTKQCIKWKNVTVNGVDSKICDEYGPATDATAQAKLLNQCFADDFKCGSWAAWLDMSQHPERNTTVGQLNLAVNRMNTQTNTKSAQATSELNRGNGFFNIKECIREKNVTVNGATEKICDEYQSTSPGQKAVALMGEMVTDPVKQSRLADEINESVSAVASAFMTDLLGRGFKVVNEEVNDLNLKIAKGVNDANNEINKQYKNIDEAIIGFTKPSADKPAPAYDGTNLPIVKLDTSSIANLSRNMLRDMTSVASSNIDYIKIANKELAILTPYIAQLNQLKACYANTSPGPATDAMLSSGREYLDDRYTRVLATEANLKKDVTNIPPKIDILLNGIRFIASSNDVNAIQAVYQAFNQMIEEGVIKKSEIADSEENKFQELDRQLYGPRDEEGKPIAKGDLEARLAPKLAECGCVKVSTNKWDGNKCIDPSTEVKFDPTTGGEGGAGQ